MLKDAISRQKEERDNIEKAGYIPRRALVAESQRRTSNLVKVIVGPRRAGKSVFATMLLKGKDYAYLNFDNEELVQAGYSELLAALSEVYGQPDYYFFDEIQNRPKWEYLVNELHRNGKQVVVTGSNAHLLSNELATALTGRHWPIQLFPFDFSEYLSAKGLGFVQPSNASDLAQNILNPLSQYLLDGGYPEVVTGVAEGRPYLSVLFDSIIFKDIIARYRMRFPGKIKDAAEYLLDNFTLPFSFRRAAVKLALGSQNTAAKYFGYLEQSYVFFFLEKYSHKNHLRKTNSKKAYVVDNGFINARGVQVTPNQGRLLENLVFVELVRRGHRPNLDLFYYQTDKNHEVDFIIKQDLAFTELIQVAYDPEQGAWQREEKALSEASRELVCDQLTVITWNYVKEKIVDGKKIIYVPLWQWLLGGMASSSPISTQS